MKVLHILHHLVPEDGYVIRSKYLMKNQNKHNNLYVLTSPFSEESRKNTITTLDEIQYYSFQKNKYMNFPYVGSIYRDYVFRKNIEQIIRIHDIDIIHSHSPAYCPRQSYKISNAENIPHIYEVRGIWEDTSVALRQLKENSSRYRYLKDIETKIMEKVDCIVTISEGLKNDIISRGIDKNKIHVIPNGVDIDKFIPLKKDRNLVYKYDLAESTVLGYIGSIRRLEGIEYLIKAMPYVIHANKSVKLLLVGGGDREYIEELKILAKDLRVAKNTIFIETVPHSDILNFYSLIDIVVIPRIRKRVTELVTPLKPLEAMTMEKLVICSNVGGLRELVRDNKTGILFEAENELDLSEKINSLIENEEERNRIGKTAREYVIAERNWEKIIEKYNEIYECLSKN